MRSCVILAHSCVISYSLHTQNQLCPSILLMETKLPIGQEMFRREKREQKWEAGDAHRTDWLKKTLKHEGDIKDITAVT